MLIGGHQGLKHHGNPRLQLRTVDVGSVPFRFARCPGLMESLAHGDADGRVDEVGERDD